jgi:transketolase
MEAVQAGASQQAALEQRCVDTIRCLAMDGVEAANSGHPGAPMALAPVAYVLYRRVMAHNPANPDWPDRDRFILSAGHASMLLYSILHLSGYELPLEELQRFRQWGSRTPGHPERTPDHETPGVETTTGPLGQGFGNGVGMAMAERFLRERFGAEVSDHRIFAICSDGDLMEGVAAEAASLAGQLGLGRLVYLYDDNQITIDGPTSLAFDTEDVEARFRAYGWHVSAVEDANDLEALETAIGGACEEQERPSLIRVRSIIAYPAPTMQGKAGAHGAPLGEEEVRATKQQLGVDPDAQFEVLAEVRAAFAPLRQHGAELEAAWEARLAAWREQQPKLASEWDNAWAGRATGAIAGARTETDTGGGAPLATRAASGAAMRDFAELVPTMIGGSADLAGSTLTGFDGEPSFSRTQAARNVHWGVREHAMGAAVNGLALHGGVVRPYGSTFLVFSDYMRPAIRLSALMQLPVTWVFSHDSVGLGEDGPTHQPIEHLAALRAIPGLTVIRPCDAAETVEAWRMTLEEIAGPVCLVLSRQKLAILDRVESPAEAGELAPATGLARGSYLLSEPLNGSAQALIVASGSEVGTALEAQRQLDADGIATAVVSMPSWELFAAQGRDYQEAVLPPDLPKVSLEAGLEFGWSRWVDASVSIDRFGASAPGDEALRRLGITAADTATAVHGLLDADDSR